MDKLLILRNELVNKLNEVIEENKEIIEMDDDKELTEEEFKQFCLIEAHVSVINYILSSIDKLEQSEM